MPRVPSLETTARLSSGYSIPFLGLGLYENDECIPACLAALEHGYRHIDSARYYRNEDQVGRAVRESGVPREDVFVTTKIYDTHHGYESTVKAVHESLQHFGFGLQRGGKLRTVGFRSAGFDVPAVNQIEVHPFCQQRPIVEYCRKHGIFVQAYCPLVRGQFDDHVLQDVARRYNKDVAQVLVRWSLQHEFSPLPKSSRPERVVSNADVYDFEISMKDMARMDALDRGAAGATSWNPVDSE
ncbi:Aldo/keto reductase [Fomitopsis betulina]|nr:Aldo/keto reductase [Fomitopsis betulina]